MAQLSQSALKLERKKLKIKMLTHTHTQCPRSLARLPLDPVWTVTVGNHSRAGAENKLRVCQAQKVRMEPHVHSPKQGMVLASSVTLTG